MPIDTRPGVPPLLTLFRRDPDKDEMVPGRPWKETTFQDPTSSLIDESHLSERVRKSLADGFYKSSEKKAKRYIELLQEGSAPEREIALIFRDRAEEIATEIMGFLGNSYEKLGHSAREVRGETVEAVFELAGVPIPDNIQKKINEVAGKKGERKIDQPTQRMT